MSHHDAFDTTATILALTASGDDSGAPAFAVRLGDSSVGRSLADALRAAGIATTRVLTRPGWELAARDAFGERAIVVAVPGEHDALTDIVEQQLDAQGQLIVPAHVSAPAYLLRSLVRFPSPWPAVLLLDHGADGVGLGVQIADGRVRTFAPDDAASGVVWIPAGNAPSTTPVGATTVDRPEPARTAGRTDDLIISTGVIASLLGAGTPVRAVSPRNGTVDLIADAGGAVRFADRRAGRLADDDARMHDAVKIWDGWFTTFFVSPYTRYVARWLGRRDVAPNTVTFASLVVALAAAALVLLDRTLPLVLAAVLLQASFALDCVDGQLARYSALFSRAGAWFDVASDRVKEFAVMLAMAAAVGMTSAWLAVSAAIAVQTMRHLANVAFSHRSSTPPAVDTSRSAVAATARRERDRAQSGGRFWFRRLATFSIGERLALLSLGMLSGAIEPILWTYLAWVTIASAVQLVGRRRQPGESPRLTAADLDLTLVVRAERPNWPGAEYALLCSTVIALGVVTWTSLDVIAVAIWLLVAVAFALHARPRSAVVVAAVDFATILFLLATTGASWQLGALAGVVAVAWADRGYWDDYSASAPKASAYLRLGLVPRQGVMLVGAALDEVEITAIAVAALVGFSVIWGWAAAYRELSGSRAGEMAAVSLT